MEYYLKKEKPPVSGFTPDAEFPLIYAEKGITIFNLVKELKKKPSSGISIKYIKGGERPNMVPDYCEAGFTGNDADAIIDKVKSFSSKTGYDIGACKKDGIVVVNSVGVSAHGSLPQDGKNAIMQLFAFIDSLNIGECDINDFITFYNKYVGMETTGDSFGVGLKDEASGCLSFNTGMVLMNEEKITLVLNLRYPVTYKYEDMMVPFNKRLEGTGIKVENMEHQGPLYFPQDHELVKKLMKVFKEHTGIEANPLAIGGGTYAKEMPNILAFGPIFPGKPDLDHQANEYIEIEDLVLNAKIYASAIYELAK
jgi:succinyl-diaminopimelate desuccinylase